MALIALPAWALNLLNIFIVPQSVINAGMPICIFLFLLPTTLIRVIPRPDRRFKYFHMGCYIVGITVLSVAIQKHTMLAIQQKPAPEKVAKKAPRTARPGASMGGPCV